MLKKCIVLILQITSMVRTVSHPAQDYGKFDLTVTKFVTCKGPKRDDCAIVNATIKSRTCIDYRISIVQTLVPTKGKVVAKSNGKQLFRLQLDNPCNHLFMRPLFHSLLNTTEDCRVVKGKYAIVIDIDKIAQTYYSGEFLYGSLEFKAVFFSKDCNLSCSEITVSISPKDTQPNNTEHK